MSLTNCSSCASAEEVIHGVVVSDPYRWLEDRNLPETQEWVQAQGHRCSAHFSEYNEIEAIQERVRQYLDVEVVDQPAKIGHQYFYRRRNRGQEQGCIYVRDEITGEERPLVDPSSEGPFISVGIYRISMDGALLAYERKDGGEDKKSIHLVNVETGILRSESLEPGYARGFTFTENHQGFYYCHEATGDTNEHIVQFYSLRNPMENQTVFRIARSCGSRLALIADSAVLGAIYLHKTDVGWRQDLWIADRNDPARWRQIFSNKELSFRPMVHGGRLFAISYDDASNGKFIELDQSGHEMATIIPNQKSMIRQLAISQERIHLTSGDPHFEVQSWCLTGERLPAMSLSDSGTVRLTPNLGDGSSLFLSYECFTEPPALYEFVIATQSLIMWQRSSTGQPAVPHTVRHGTYSSRDGTTVPITLVGNWSAATKTSVPVVMTSYGGFGISTSPQFSVLISILLECGALFALPHIRGGGEFGRSWHDAGRGRNKQSSFDDFLAAAEWLCQRGVTTPQQLAIFGGSHSGLLVGVAMTQRPDLFRAVLCIAPLLDMIRYEHFDQATKWTEEYGSVTNEDDFKVLYSFSPYHHVRRDVTYPAVLFVSGDKDDRCNAAHVRKMAARLMENPVQRNPILLDYSNERGHSPVLPFNIRVEALTRRIAFLCRELNLPFGDRSHYETPGA
jgi:prolyl oligopeptidase